MLKCLGIIAACVLLQIQPLQPQTVAQPGNHAASAQTHKNPEPSPPVVVKVDNHVTCEECSKKDSVATEDPNKWVRRGFFLNSGLTLITLVIAIATLIQATAAKAAVNLSRDTAKKQLRAYICVASARLNFRKDGHIEALIYLKNGGQTPAYDVRGSTSSVVREHPLAHHLVGPPLGIFQGRSVIPPNGEQIAHAELHKDSESWHLLPMVYMRKHALYAYGECKYEDVFGDPHTLAYRLIFGGQAGATTQKDDKGNVFAMMCMDIDGNDGD